MNDWSDEETDNPVIPDDRNFYKVERWTKDGLHIANFSTPAMTSKRRAGFSPRLQVSAGAALYDPPTHSRGGQLAGNLRQLERLAYAFFACF